MSGEDCLAAVRDPSQPGHGRQPRQVQLAAQSRNCSVRRQGAECQGSQLDIIQRSPGWVTTVQVKYVSEAVLALAFDGVVIG